MCRVGGGFWRRGGETPLPVKWEDRIIEIREGSWSYIAGSIGRSPGMVYSYMNRIFLRLKILSLDRIRLLAFDLK